MNSTWRACRHPFVRIASDLLTTAAVLLTAACTSSLRDVAPDAAQAGREAALTTLPEARPPQGLAFAIVHTGRSKGAQEALIVEGGSWFKRRQPAQAAVVVRHPQATFLFDSGLGRQLPQQFAVNTWLDRQFFAYQDVQPVADQLAQAGWPLARIAFIVPSHMHWDHVSGLPDFPHAPVWVRPEELEHARHGHAPAFLASQFAHVQQWRELRFTHGAYMGFDRSLDMFSDGSVVLVPLTGHTAGQVGMFLNLPSGQRYFFTGDVTWTIEGLRTPADRSWLLRQILHVDHDVAANQACILQIHRLMKRFPTLRVVPAHDENVLGRLPRFPDFQG